MAMEIVKHGEEELGIKPENIGPKVDYASQPLLLKNYDKRCQPHSRDIKSYISSGVINLDKPSNVCARLECCLPISSVC
ncbi:TruB family pseudouridylate synthase [Colletotrichum musicola]|uniref:TruB family pseudouridylate synthase n=1 Tax=Colletotrichum musicola TaxID=2175873 RepID=A0A8H6U9H0_9PEZI|nr:TruB family pseudouridylate synthase [Colletotrichum musicola]